MSETENLPAPRRAKTKAEIARDNMAALIKAVEDRHDMLVTLLADTGIRYEKFLEVFRRALIKGQDDPKTNLLLANPVSVIQACIDACTAGLLPDGKQGAIVIFNSKVKGGQGERDTWVKKAQFIPMYQGLLEIAYASGHFQSIMAHVVYDVDAFDYELGINPWIKHKPGPRPALPTDADGKVIGKGYEVLYAYAVAKTKDGGIFLEVFQPEDIRKVMAVSKAKSGPARDWPEEMARKGPLRRMWKFLPRSERMDRVLEVDDESYDLDAIAPVEERAEPALKRGFAALPQGADPVMPPMATGRDEDDGRDAVPAQGAGGEAPSEQRLHREADDGESLPADAEDDDGEPEIEEAPARVTEAWEKLGAADNWLSIKQALRSLYKAEDWDRGDWEIPVLERAWERHREVQDGTDYVQDVWLFAAWLCGVRPKMERLSEDFALLQTQADWKRAGDDTQAWLTALVEGYDDGE